MQEVHYFYQFRKGLCKEPLPELVSFGSTALIPSPKDCASWRMMSRHYFLSFNRSALGFRVLHLEVVPPRQAEDLADLQLIAETF